MSKSFGNPNRYWALGSELTTVIACLNTALDGNGAISIHASKSGLRIAFRGHTIAKGKTPMELHRNFEARVAEGKKGDAS